MKKTKEETAFVLFVDIVQYSQRRLNIQQKVVKHLTKILIDILDRYSISRVWYFPTGDGFVITFLNDRAPLKCAWALTDSLLKHNNRIKWSGLKIQLRMGIHCAKVLPVRTGLLEEQSNFVGPAINMAQRIMDCGDSGHILCSESYRLFLKDTNCEALFNFVGEHLVKGDTIKIFNMFGSFSLKSKDGGTKRIRAGSPEPPKERPFVNVTSIPIHFGEHKQLASFFFQGFENGMHGIRNANVWVYGDDVWERVNPILENHEEYRNPKVRLELISLINPNKWESDPHWLEYNRKVAKIARKQIECLDEADIKRMHVLSSDEINHPTLMENLISLMICECISNILCRAVFVPPGKVIIESETYRFLNFALMDYGTYRTGQHKDIIFSNITPYFIQKNKKKWGITTFDSAEDNIYHSLLANFYRNWNTPPSDFLYTLPDLLNLARKKREIKLTNIVSNIIKLFAKITNIDIAREVCKSKLDEILDICLEGSGKEIEKDVLQEMNKLCK